LRLSQKSLFRFSKRSNCNSPKSLYLDSLRDLIAIIPTISIAILVLISYLFSIGSQEIPSSFLYAISMRSSHRIVNLPKFTSLNIEGNEIEYLPSWMLKLNRLQYINVKKNYLHSLIWQRLLVNQMPSLFAISASRV